LTKTLLSAVELGLFTELAKGPLTLPPSLRAGRIIYYDNMPTTIPMRAVPEKAFGYQGNMMNLPVQDLAAAFPFYERVLGFRVVSRADTPHNSAVLVRDKVQIGLAENGGDPTQDGCAFHVNGLQSLLTEFKANGLQKELSDIDVEQRDGVAWKVFYVVAPDGLCYWFGEREADVAHK
jgi:catechol 2,3-dioxygenase-like lactoylglutathione lyase family enzyme